MNFKTLYGKTKLGQVTQWDIFVEGNSFYTVEGMVGGVLTKSEPTICEATNVGRANERSPEAQAVFEADAKRKKKLKTGHSENIEEAGNKGYIEPQRAKKTKDYPEEIETAALGRKIIQRKLNGGRGILFKHEMKSRKGELYVSVPHIIEDTKSYQEANPSAVIDGELYNNNLRQHLNELVSIVRTKKKEKLTEQFLKRSKDIVEFHVYDYFDDETPKNIPYKIRMAKFRKLVNLGMFGPSIKVIEDFKVSSYEELMNMFNKELDDGGEGLIIRDEDAPYEHGQTKHVLKMKPEEDDEAIIVSIVKGSGNWGNCAKVATLLWNGKTFDADFVGKDAMEKLVKVWEEKDKWIGKKITFYYVGLTSDTAAQVPNYAKIDINNCACGDKVEGAFDDEE